MKYKFANQKVILVVTNMCGQWIKWKVVVQEQQPTTDMHFTVMAFTSGTGEPMMFVCSNNKIG
jgi:hypothetical protein